MRIVSISISIDVFLINSDQNSDRYFKNGLTMSFTGSKENVLTHFGVLSNMDSDKYRHISEHFSVLTKNNSENQL